MALKEGRCPNCGSILHLNPAAENGHCMFCDAVFTNQQAFEIAANPKDYEFPNLPQPKYEGPDLDPRPSGATSVPAPRKQQAAPRKPAEAKSTYVMKEPVKLPDFKLSRKTRLQILAGVLAILLIVAAIAVPVVLRRDQARGELMAAMDALAPFAIDIEQDVNISRAGNTHLMVVAEEAVSQADAVTFFKAYCEKRAAVMGLDSQDPAIYSQVRIKLITPEGGWLIDRPDSLQALQDGTAVKALKP